MVPSLWGQVSWHNACAPRASASMAQPNKAEDTLRRSTSVKIHMHRNSPPTAVLSCKSLYLWIGPAFDGSSSFFIFAFSIPPYFAARLDLLHPCSFPYSDQPSSNGQIEMSVTRTASLSSSRPLVFFSSSDHCIRLDPLASIDRRLEEATAPVIVKGSRGIPWRGRVRRNFLEGSWRRFYVYNL